MKVDQMIDFQNTEVAFSMKSDRQLKEMFRLFSAMNNNHLVRWGSSMTLFAVRMHIPFIEKMIEKTIFSHFCGGTDLFACQSKIENLYQEDVSTILDYGAEAKDTESDFDQTLEEQKKSIDFAASNDSVPVVSVKISGLADFDILEKVQKAENLTSEESEAFEEAQKRLYSLCEHAEHRGVSVMIDAEESWIQRVIDELVLEMMSQFNKERVIVYHTYQLYRKDKLDELIENHKKSRAEGWILGAKIVRGAYMVKERKRAEEYKYECPVHDNKSNTDHDFDAAVRYCVEHHDEIAMCNATHNVESCRLMATLIAKKVIPNNHPHLNFCQLYGMSDFITFNLADAGYNVAKYMPYGAVRDVIPYLIRRAQENTSITGEMSRELRLIREEISRRKRS